MNNKTSHTGPERSRRVKSIRKASKKWHLNDLDPYYTSLYLEYNSEIVSTIKKPPKDPFLPRYYESDFSCN